MKKLFLSIITPTYNRANKLHKAFTSLMHQTNKNFQWIIIDDGSSDETKSTVEKFIQNADFPIVYKKIKHGGKHIATRTAYKIALGEYSLELDSDDELYDEETVDVLQNWTKSVSKKYVCFGGCFINQNDEIFPHFDGDYIDFDQDKYLEYFCDAQKIDMLNAPWLFKTDYAKSVLPPLIHDNLTYYPEAVINISRVLKCRDFNMRLFNRPIYRYYIYNSDSVSVNTYKTNADWYYALGMLELFHKYKLLDKYPGFVENNIKKLFNSISQSKTLHDVCLILKRIDLGRYYKKYLMKYLIKQIFSIKRAGTQRLYTILGFTIHGGRK